MLDEYYAVAARLPDPFAGELAKLDPQIAPFVQELRLRAGQPLLFTIKGRLSQASKFLPRAEAVRCLSADALQRCFAVLCRCSVYAHEEELRQGYFTMAGGCRVGVAGVLGPAGFNPVTSLNLRVARRITCALPPEIQQRLSGPQGGILIAGAPGSGKTTFLRSMITFLERGERIFCVVDERGELLAADSGGLPPASGAVGDVYTRCPKAEAIHMALRCMNPQIILCDELGTRADAAALEAGMASGVVFFASVHCDTGSNLQALERKPLLRRLLATGAFSTVVFLESRARPGTVARVEALSI